MTNTLTEMPKVGDEVRYLGGDREDKGNLTVGFEYEICRLDSEGDAVILNDLRDNWFLHGSNIGCFELVTETQPTVPELLANLGRRLSEVEAELEMAKEHKYYDDLVEAYADLDDEPEVVEGATSGLSSLYPKYYKDVTGIESIDVYMTHELFQIDDPSGAIHHASKKLLLSGVRTGGKSKYNDIKEARDTLNRWLEINVEEATE